MKKQQKYVIASATKQSIRNASDAALLRLNAGKQHIFPVILSATKNLYLLTESHFIRCFTAFSMTVKQFFLLPSAFFLLISIISTIPNKILAQACTPGSSPETFNATCIWTCPAGVGVITVQCWGGGGGGAGDMGASAGGGGGGGGYSSKIITVVPGNTYSVTVGAGGSGAAAGGGDGTDGGDSWFDNNTVILAKGGKKGLGNGGAAASGGAGGIGTYTVTGGNGGVGGGVDGGGGGEAGGSSANGANASGATAGSGNNADGGDGGAGTGTDGVAGNAPGGGGGGGGDDAGDDGAAGAAGRVVISYVTSGTANTSTTAWVPPFQVISVDAQCWGAGGGGGGGNVDGGSGGGGGGYSSKTVSVTPGTTYSVTVGTKGAGHTGSGAGGNGGDSWFSTTATVLAKGGLGGGGDGSSAGRTGGAKASGVGTFTVSGGDGASFGGGSNDSGGGGGEAGGSSADGEAGAVTAGGDSNNADGGNGGNGSPNNGSNGGPGIAPGGGGGGGGNSGDSDGGNGADGQVTLTWSTCTNSCNQPTGLAASNIGTTTMTLGWTRGSPTPGTGGVLIVVGTSVITDPTANVSAANAAYGSAPTAGNGKAVYDGTGTSVNITGLTAGTTYYFAAYEFNTGRCYNLTSEGRIDAGVATCSAPANQATTFTRSAEAATTMTLGWTRGTPAGGSKVLILARGGSAVATDPTDGVTYTANAAYASGTAIGSAYVVYDGTGTSQALTNLTSGTTYHFAAYEYNTPTACYNLTELTGNYCNKPVTPGSITGTAAQCKNTTGQTYSVAAVTGATSYTWTVPTNWSVTAGAGTNSITVTTSVNVGDNGNITVTANNACGSSAAQTLAVTLDLPDQASIMSSN